MADVHSPKIRSYNMSKIKGNNTKPELLVRKFLFNNGFRYRINDKNYAGHPDIVLSKYKTAIFVNGCFWHVHRVCNYFVWPESNHEFWKKKLLKNVERDQRNYNLLVNKGWKVIVVWECELKKEPIERLNRLLKEILSGGHI